MSTFFETTWFLWWLFAALIVGWWSWRLLAKDRIAARERSAPWRNLYRQALLEQDTHKIGIRIEEAEGAILLELATHVFTRHSTERIALQDAMNNLRSLRQNYSERSDRDLVAQLRK